MDAVLLALILVRTVKDRCKLFTGDILEGFGAAHIASIRIDEQEWLDFRYTSDDPSYSNELPEMCTLDFSDSHSDIGEQRLEVKVAK